MKNFFVIAVLGLAATAQAKPAENFCAPQAIAAAKALAKVNGSVDQIAVAESSAGTLYIVELKAAIGEDYYSVLTSGDHDCIVKSVELNGGVPTRYP